MSLIIYGSLSIPYLDIPPICEFSIMRNTVIVDFRKKTIWTEDLTKTDKLANIALSVWHNVVI